VILADSDSSDLVALTAIFFIFGLPIVCWFGMRWLAHRERMEMIRNGIDPGPFRRGRDWHGAQQPQGSMPGPVYPPRDYGYAYAYPNEAAQIALRKAIVIVAVGFALTIGLSFIGFRGDRFTLGPWLLGGLIPLFVGLAQVFSAMAAGATLRPFQTNAQFGPIPQGTVPPPPGPPPPPGAQAPPSAGSYTYRPGMTPELRPPTPPPAPRD
jgi:hypothetical protein